LYFWRNFLFIPIKRKQFCLNFAVNVVHTRFIGRVITNAYCFRCRTK